MHGVRVVVITDRRLYASEEIAGRALAIARGAPRGRIAFQLREKDLDGGPLLQLARELVEVAGPVGAPVWINDRVDVARSVGAHGVHLPERGLAIADARAVGAGLAVACSRHSLDGVAAAVAAGVDAIQVGPIWEVPGKGPALGPSALAVMRSAAGTVPLVAVGGVDTADRAFACAQAGADAVAVIRAAWTARHPERLIGELVAAVEAGIAARDGG